MRTLARLTVLVVVALIAGSALAAPIAA